MDTSLYTVNVNLDQTTINLLNGGTGGKPWTLLGFKAVSSSAEGQPVVWFSKTGVFMSPLVLSWREDDYAFISDSLIVAGGTITTMDGPSAINPGQMATYDGTTFNIGAVVGDPQNITIYNSSKDAGLVCGLAKMQPTGVAGAQTAVPICAFDIHGMNEVVMLPLVKIVLMFTSEQVNTSSVAEQAYGPGMSIDLTGNGGNATMFTMSYDLDNGWNNGGAGWGVEVTPNEALSPILNPAKSTKALIAQQSKRPQLQSKNGAA